MERRAKAELLAVILTGAVFLVFENILHAKIPFLVACFIGWTIYLVKRRDFREWGIRTDNLGAAAKPALLFFVVLAGAMAAYRLVRGWHPLPAGSVIVFAVYPVWGFIQQFLVQVLIAGNLKKLGVGPWVIVPAAALLFGLAHIPDWPLVALCTGAGVAWTILFQRIPNLIPLALCHAWLGTLVYYWVLERDPWKEMFP